MTKRLIKLLKVLGQGVVTLGLDTNEELELLLEKGKAWNNSDIKRRKGEPNQCHRNSAILYEQKSTWKIASGYALFEGRWVQHSWIIDAYKRVGETTPIKFEKYYGYILTKKESKVFVDENL